MYRRGALVSVRSLVVLAVVVASVSLFGWPGPRTLDAQADGRYFADSGYRIDNDVIWDYFSHRGGVRTFGQPTSRTFQFMGAPTQFFQRQIVQVTSGGPRTLNLLDDGLLPYTHLNGSTVPAADPALAAAAPSPSSPGYGQAVVDFIEKHAPDTFDGEPVRFAETFGRTVTLADAFPNGSGSESLLPILNLELWGMPTSKPTRDPANNNFIYQRYQRGIMHYDASCKCTQGLLLADYVKAIMTGQNLPDDLAAQAASSPLYKQYDVPSNFGPLRRTELASTNLANAFKLSNDSSPNADPPAPAPAPSTVAARPLPGADPPLVASAPPATSGGSTEASGGTTAAATPTAPASGQAAPTPTPTVEGASTTSSKEKGSSGKSLTVTENEYAISPGSPTVQSGKVTIKVTNSGAIKHELVILKTDSAPDALPKVAKKDEADEEKAGTTAGEFGALAPGASNSADFDLAPGHYVLICNIAGHYSKGMAAEFTVK